MATQMLQRRGTAAQWATANPILGNGEIGFETDTKIIKIGDGSTPWTQLTTPYVSKRGGDVVIASAPGVTPAVLRGAAGQTADIFRAETSDGATSFRVDNTGVPRIGTSALAKTSDLASYLLATGKAADSDKLDGLDSTDFLRATAKAADADKLDGLDSTAFLGATAKAADADKLDGFDSFDFLRKGHADAVGSPTRGGKNTLNVTNLNQPLVSGWYDGNNMVGAPNGSWWLVQVISHSNGAQWQRQIAYEMTDGNTSSAYALTRRCNGGDPTVGGNWGPWMRMDPQDRAAASHGHDYAASNHGHAYAATSHGHDWGQIATGTYWGDNGTGRVIYLPWACSFIIVNCDQWHDAAITRGPDTYGTAIAFNNATRAGIAMTTGAHFYVYHGGADLTMNASGNHYRWVAMRQA